MVLSSLAMRGLQLEIKKGEKIQEEPVFAVWDEIGQMSDKMIAEKLASEELDSKIKASKINVKKVVMENQNMESNFDEGSLSRELLTHHPLAVEMSHELTEAPDSKLGRLSETITTEILSDILVNNIAEKVPEIEKVATNLETTVTAEEPIDLENYNEIAIGPLGSENIENMSDVIMEPSSETILTLKKTNRVNPLLKNVITMKMSRARKTADKITPGDDDESADYPDLPTFRGVKID